MRGGIWIPIFILALNIVLAQNLGFEDGLTFWIASYSGNAQYIPDASSNFSFEGNYSARFGGNSGMVSAQGHSASINHTALVIEKDDQVCLDIRRELVFNDGQYKLSSAILGFQSSIALGNRTNVCTVSQNTGLLDLTVSGNNQFGCPCGNSRAYIDNIRIYSCDDGILNQNETDIDCGGPFCDSCSLGQICKKHTDCDSLYCSENGICSEPPSFSHMFNYNFEIGSNDYWRYNYTSGGQDYSSSVNQFWRSEGNYSLALPRINSGIHTLNGHSATFFHNSTVLEAGDEVCFNMKKNSTSLSKWRVDLVSGGEIFSSIPSGEYIHVCENSTGNGSLGITVAGTETFSCSLGAQCFARFFFDNISVNANKCDNLALDHFETDVDCGGFCGKCSLGKACLFDFDCENNECLDGFCGGFVSEEESLLEKYAPVLYFHPDEQFFPTTIEAMLNESDLKEDDVVLDDLIDELPVDVNSLNGSDVTNEYFLDMRNASGGNTDDVQVPNQNRFSRYNPNIYARELNVSNKFNVLQYWFFYPFNHFNGGHEGDWEMIQLILNQSSNTPLSITYPYHYNAVTYNWEEISTINQTHPKVYVALGGHASYKDSKSIWRYGFLEDIPDNSTNIIYGRQYLNQGQSYSISKIENNTAWVYYPGRWGGFVFDPITNFYDGPNSPANIEYGSQTNRWNNPIEFAQDSRPNEQSAVTGSPVNLHAYDKHGNHVGLNGSGEIEVEILNTYLYLPSNGSKEVIVILTDEEISYVIESTGTGAFNLSVSKYNKYTKTETNASYQDILINDSTMAFLNVTDTNPNFILKIDHDEDGIIDTTFPPTQLSIEGNQSVNKTDSDNDGFSDLIDNCPQLYNPNQETDFDLDGFDNLLCGGYDCNDDDSSVNPDSNETCNNIDDNCNNEIDENLTRICGLTDIGICTFGEESCSSGNWQDCSAIFPEFESCNNLDDNCNYFNDENFNISDACSLGVGECKADGFFICSADNQSSICNAVPDDPETELCDENDNDCDSIVDNDCAINSKLQAIWILENEKTGNCPIRGICKDNIIEQIVESIQKSLNPSYFIDNETLSESGLNVFKHESHAVLLCDRMEEKTGMELACAKAITLMKAADKRFAENTIDYAKSLTIQDSRNKWCYDKKIGTAELYIRNAEDFFTKYFPNKVVDRYGLAWKNAQEAARFAVADKDIC